MLSRALGLPSSFITVVCYIVLSSADSWAVPPTATVDRIISTLSDTDSKFDSAKHSFLFRYRLDSTGYNLAGQPDPILGRWVNSTYARKKKMLYSKVQSRFLSATYVDDETNIWKDGICVQRKSSSISILPFLLPQARAHTALCNLSGFDVFRGLEWTSPSEHEDSGYATCLADEAFWVLPKILIENRKRYKLLPQLENIQGDLCHVLEWQDHDRIWLDAQRGFSVRKRVFSLGTSKPAMEWELNRATQLKPGLWISSEATDKRYSDRIAPDGTGQPLLQELMTIKLLEFRHDDLPDDLFRVTLPPDEQAVISDSVRKMTYMRHPDGADPITKALEDAEVGRPRTSRRTWMLVNAIVLGLLSLALIVRLSRRNLVSEVKP